MEASVKAKPTQEERLNDLTNQMAEFFCLSEDAKATLKEVLLSHAKQAQPSLDKYKLISNNYENRRDAINKTLAGLDKNSQTYQEIAKQYNTLDRENRIMEEQWHYEWWWLRKNTIDKIYSCLPNSKRKEEFIQVHPRDWVGIITLNVFKLDVPLGGY